MKNSIYLFLALSTIWSFASCDNESIDLTEEVVGEYVGAYASNATAQIDNYEVRVSKIDDTNIRIQPVTGNEFDAWETEIERFNSSKVKLL